MKLSTAIRNASKKLPKVNGNWYKGMQCYSNATAKMQRRRDVVCEALTSMSVANNFDIEYTVYTVGYHSSIRDLLDTVSRDLKIIIE